jgi:DNA repair protein RadC
VSFHKQVIEEIQKVKGVGQSQSNRLKAALELGKRLVKTSERTNQKNKKACRCRRTPDEYLQGL